MHIKKHFYYLCLLFASLSSTQLQAEDLVLNQAYETQVSISNDKTPLWLNANKYGLSSLNQQNGYFRGALSIDQASTTEKNWGYGAGIDVVIPLGYKTEGYADSYTSHIILQQLYAHVNYKNIVLSVGARQQPLFLKYQGLSSGSQTLGINARPVPQFRLGLGDWWNIPGLNRWAAVMGHISYGIMTDGNWEEAFAKNSIYKYNKWTRYHEKAGYLRIGKTEKFPLTFIFGLEMAAQFGGDLYQWYGTDQTNYSQTDKVALKSNLKSYWNAFLPGGADTDETEFQNAEGNQLGSWILRFDWTTPQYTIGLYADHFFEDHSAMFLLDYDGYGDGDLYNSKEDFKFLFYPLKDILIGLDVKFSTFKYIKGAIVEFLNTKYQSGPIYHDHNKGNSDHIGGNDNYYNHSTLSGWQHWGQVMGNPLYLSPQYNSNGYIGTLNNRFSAWHFGLEGNVVPNLDYRVLYTWQNDVGTYFYPYSHAYDNTSILLELSYQMPQHSAFSPLKIKASYGADFGQVRGNNSGLQFTIQYHL